MVINEIKLKLSINVDKIINIQPLIIFIIVIRQFLSIKQF